MKTVDIIYNAEIVSQGKNLEILNRYARKFPIISIRVIGSQVDNSASLFVNFSNGACGASFFNSFEIALEWLFTKRSQYWKGISVEYYRISDNIKIHRVIGAK